MTFRNRYIRLTDVTYQTVNFASKNKSTNTINNLFYYFYVHLNENKYRQFYEIQFDDQSSHKVNVLQINRLIEYTTRPNQLNILNFYSLNLL